MKGEFKEAIDIDVDKTPEKQDLSDNSKDIKTPLDEVDSEMKEVIEGDVDKKPEEQNLSDNSSESQYDPKIQDKKSNGSISNG